MKKKIQIHERWDNAPLWFYSCCIAVKLVSISRPSIIFTTTGSPDTWGVRLFAQSNTKQNQIVPTVAASTSALQFEHLPSKVNTLSEKHDWRLQSYTSLSNMCVIGTTQRTRRSVNYRMHGDALGRLFVCVEVSWALCVVLCLQEKCVSEVRKCVYMYAHNPCTQGKVCVWLLPTVHVFLKHKKIWMENSNFAYKHVPLNK